MQKDTDTTTHADWRDYVDELTLDQVEELISWEGQPDGGRGSSMRRKALAACARDMARRNRWAREYADVPAPADATYVHAWDPWDDVETPARYFEGFRCPLVHVGGIQNADGSVRERWISITANVDDLDPATARALARQLAAAADQLEQVAFDEAVAGLSDLDGGVSYRDACKAGVAVVQADADTFGVAL
jgi:hypothetical protein